MPPKRVVITGIGVITPLGNDKESTFDNLIKGRAGISHITRFDPQGLSCQIAGELKDPPIGDFIPQKDMVRFDPFVHYAAISAIMAVKDAGLIKEDTKIISSPGLAGVVIGSSRGGITSIERALSAHLLDRKMFSAYLMSASTISMAASYIAMRLGIRGQLLGVSTACASGTNAIGEAFRLIRNGEVVIAIAGAAEAPICRVSIGGYDSAGALSRRNKEPQKASRPFDKERDGFVISEGAGVIVLEEFTHALDRGARIYAEIIGYGKSADAFHQTMPDSEGEAISIRSALDDAKVSPGEVNYINAHATSTPVGDRTEVKAIKMALGRSIDNISVSAHKSMLGHMLGASGAVETAMTAISIYRGIIPPTINLDNLDPECELNHVTSTTHKEINIAIKNSFGFGGINAVLVLKRFHN